MDEVQIDIVDAKVLERLLQSLRNTGMVDVVELGGEEDLFARDTGVFDALTDFLLVAIGGRTVTLPSGIFRK